MSADSQVHLSSNENNKRSKSLLPLFPKRDECSHVSCYCEENVWKLCQDISLRFPEELVRCYVVFISNPCRTVPLWKQRAGREEDRLVIWDYHVIFLYSLDCQACLVYDLDSELPFPTFFHKYVTETFRTDQVLKSDFHRFFRVVPAKQFFQQFASDRRHMKRPDGSWIKPPPPYPAISTPNCIFYKERRIQNDYTAIRLESVHETFIVG
ncbi:unnamed protein product [Arctia plantaginis]|uniref:Protein N-terminal glutamine amidohydrolase n=1 Tax=Arctia plantaginis TaxID=874455 RepID=A0A8S1B486_ARCPL|nr:unnamed protein product [Arctia plantaginis]